MSQPLPPREPVRPAVLRLARRATALKDATRRLRRWPRRSARPSLTAAVRLALGCSGRDEKTAFQPNQKTGLAAEAMRTTHPLQKADIFTRHRHSGNRPPNCLRVRTASCFGPANTTLPGSPPPQCRPKPRMRLHRPRPALAHVPEQIAGKSPNPSCPMARRSAGRY